MANPEERPWILNAVPFLVVLSVVILIAVHVFALVYWIYRLATDNKAKPQQQQLQQPQQLRRKAN